MSPLPSPLHWALPAAAVGRRGVGHAHADLCLARRRGPRTRSVPSGQSHPPARAGHCLSARRRLGGRHAHDRAGLPPVLRAGRLRDGVNRVQAHAVDHVPRQCRGRAHGRALAEGQRRRTWTRRRSHLPVGHVGGRPPGGRRRSRAARHLRGHGQSRPDKCRALRTRRLRSDALRPHGRADDAGAADTAEARSRCGLSTDCRTRSSIAPTSTRPRVRSGWMCGSILAAGPNARARNATASSTWRASSS